jgi:hypothetical protein
MQTGARGGALYTSTPTISTGNQHFATHTPPPHEIHRWKPRLRSVRLPPCAVVVAPAPAHVVIMIASPIAAQSTAAMESALAAENGAAIEPVHAMESAAILSWRGHSRRRHLVVGFTVSRYARWPSFL